jgi:hypothetical protein
MNTSHPRQTARQTPRRLFGITFGALLACMAAASGPQLAFGQTPSGGRPTATGTSTAATNNTDANYSTENAKLLLELLAESQTPGGFGTQEYFEKQNQEWMLNNMPKIEFRSEPKPTPWGKIFRAVGLIITAAVGLAGYIQQRRAAKKAKQTPPTMPTPANPAMPNPAKPAANPMFAAKR